MALASLGQSWLLCLFLSGETPHHPLLHPVVKKREQEKPVKLGPGTSSTLEPAASEQGSQFRQEPKDGQCVLWGGHRVPLTSSCLSARQTGLSSKCHTATSWLTLRIWMELEAVCPRRSRPNCRAGTSMTRTGP